MAQEKIVSIRDYNATLEHDFPFHLGQELSVDADGNKAIVENAVWEGEDAPATFYTVTYYLRASDGTERVMGLNDLLPFNDVQ